VDRPLTDADAAFRDRTIEAEEHAEQAVVGKEARVTEEISLRKDSADRQETVTDTVRKTEVEIEDDRAERERRDLNRR
jgi:stress response protein YsnF